MKFYFCEGCGTRITDKDIEQGEGRNKKLRGVYCKKCSAGVMTLETMPMNEETARTILASEKPATTSSTPKKKSSRHSSGIRTGSGKSGAERTRNKSLKMPQEPKNGNYLSLILVATGILVAVLAGFIFSEKKNAPKTTRASTNKRKSKRTKPTSSIPANKLATTPAKPKPSQKIPEPGKPVSDFPSTQPNVASDPVTEPNQHSPTEAPKPEVTAAPVAPKTAPPSPNTANTTTVKPDEAKPSKPVGPSKAEMEFSKRLNTFLSHVAAKDFESLNRAAKKWQAHELSEPIKPLADALNNLVPVLERREGERKKHFASLIGKSLSLLTKTGPLKGKITAVSGKSLKLTQEYTINGKVNQGATFTIKFTNIKPESLAKLQPNIPFTSDMDWMAEAITRLSAKQIERSLEALKNCPKHPLVTSVQTRIEKERSTILEQEAQIQWKEWSSKYNAGVTRSEATKHLDELNRYAKKYAQTLFIQKIKEELGKTQAALQSTALRSKELIQAGLRGHIVNYNANSGRTVVRYQFKKPSDLLDFNSRNTKTKFKVKNGKIGAVNKNERVLIWPHFDTTALELEFVLRLESGLAKISIGTTNAFSILIQPGKIKLIPPVNKGIDSTSAESTATEKSGNLPNPAMVRIQKDGPSIQVSVNGIKWISAKFPVTPSGHRFAIQFAKGTLGTIQNLAIGGEPKSSLLEEVQFEQGIRRSLKNPNRWTNAAGDGRWSNAGNWSLKHIPTTTEHVVFDGSHPGNCRVSSGSIPARLKGFTMFKRYSGTVRFDANFGSESPQTLTIDEDCTINGGTWIVSANISGQGATATGQGMTLNAKNFWIGSLATLHSDKNGFPQGTGPGSGGNRAGASHGGYGLGKTFNDRRYGAASSPTSLGSGAQNCSGGGAISIQCPKGSVTVNGAIRCNGNDGQKGDNKGGGAGGSIFIHCLTFKGGHNGSLQAKGGNSTWAAYGGGGGRISVTAKDYHFDGIFNLAGGNSSEKTNNIISSAGTIMLPNNTDLIVTKSVGLESGDYTFNHVTVKRGATLYIYSNRKKGRGVKISTNQFIVEKEAKVIVWWGYKCKQGLKGTNSSNAAGGSHGGKGGDANMAPYGDPFNPTTLGAGGGSHANRAWGGGALQVYAPKGLIRIDGELDASGKQGGDWHVGGGAGGSVLFVSHTFEGAGRVKANGGKAGGQKSSGGGGGRIAVYYQKDTFTGTVEAKGGKGGADGKDGAEGSVHKVKGTGPGN